MNPKESASGQTIATSGSMFHRIHDSFRSDWFKSMEHVLLALAMATVGGVVLDITIKLLK